MPHPSTAAPGVQPAATALADPLPLGFVPSTPHQAYCVGHDAAQRGDDLVVVIYAALRYCPLDRGVIELAELIASASLGYWLEAEGGVR